MSSAFEARQGFEPPRTELPSYPPGDFENNAAHYATATAKIMGAIPPYPQGITSEGLSSIIVGSSTEIRPITRGDLTYLLEECLLGTQVKCNLAKGLLWYSTKQP